MGLCASANEERANDFTPNPSRDSDDSEEEERDEAIAALPVARRKSRRKSFMRADTDSVPSVLVHTLRKASPYVQIGDVVVDSIDDYYEPCVPDKDTKPDKGQPFFPHVVSNWSFPGVELGKGQFGTVARAVNKQHGYVAALKAVKKPKKAVAKKNELEALKNEVKLLTKLTGHPSIVSLFEVIETSTHLYLSQEICQGEELFNAISHFGNFSERDAASVMSDILSALSYMHSHDIMHRDLKPENILLTIKAKDTGIRSMEDSVGGKTASAGAPSICAVKLVDFGLATFDTVKSAAKAGTPYYIAPEVLMATSRNRYGRACDMWSTGVIMYIMLCGYPPFFGDTDQEIYARITQGFKDLEGGSFPPEDWNIVSDGAKDLIRKLLQPAPEDRPTAEQARKHNWIESEGPSLPKALHSAVMRKLTKFQHINKFKQVAKRIIAEEIDERDITHLKEAFDAYDSDKSGTISIKELKTALEKQAREASSKRRSKSKKNVLFDTNTIALLEQMDLDGDGQIDYHEFLVATMKTKHWYTHERLTVAFERLDDDNSGYLEREEVIEALGGDDYHLAHEIVDKFDVDGDGRISFEEFKDMMMHADEVGELGIL